MLRIEMLSNKAGWISAEYDMFFIGSSVVFYEMYLGVLPPPATGVYNGDGGDSMQFPGPAPPTMTPYLVYHGFMPFSTSDKQTGPAACASSNQGGWWYNNCLYALLNTDSSSNFVWKTLDSNPVTYKYQLTVSRMMIKLV